MIAVVDARRLPAGPGSSNLLAAPVGTDDRPRTVGPFAVVGHHRVAAAAPGALPIDADVRPHPHVGLAAISYVLDGHMTHRDALGHRCELVAGSVGLLVAGQGVAHSERFERDRLFGLGRELFQILIALPDGGEDVAPSFLHVAPERLRALEADGAVVRWLAHPDARVGAPLPLPTPTLLADVTLAPGARWSPPELPERAAYVFEGTVEVGGARAGVGQVVLLPPGEVVLQATGSARLLAFGGLPVGPRWSWWNYLHSSLDRIEAARAAWREGRVALPVGDTESFTPAPPDDGRPLRRLNAG